MALGVDENIPDDLLNSIRKIDGMENAVCIYKIVILTAIFIFTIL